MKVTRLCRRRSVRLPLAPAFRSMLVEAPETMRESSHQVARDPPSVSSTHQVPEGAQERGGTRGSRACCFCWCCCCSCSCLSMKNTAKEESGGGSMELANGDANDNPTMEEIRVWSHSFDAMMKSARGRRRFRDFLRSEYSEENLLFWLACEELGKESNSAAVEEKARLIYEDYISILSPKEVSLDSRVREAVNKNMDHPTPHTFDEAQHQIYILMHRDSFPRFLNSKMFRRMIENASRGEKK
ncbi:regulator of G-protein signaling 17-like isoform X1 [Acanthaster planci]|uniref:Regulator of G-protein signaling 17-like isoform X1 n=2 Tax=Acanthaster planci TaxID=133434 RepID=A0A8B7ZBT6_ACAPL|nr:regulator of G-protein signaling 17-like isoform X1 [Acanthaster planci]XP_022102286.1 regulator of G-protein signaling 17-like isoform X1 [Acanthaster planci]